MGITSLDESDEANPSLSLGGMKHGITVEENVNAFSTLANNGKFIDGYMIEKITTSSGDIVYEHEVEEVDVFSPQTAYLTIDMMRDVIGSGTGAYLKNSQLKYGGVDWAGKTGTSNDYHDAWFVGMNPNVTFATWIGYDDPASIYCQGCALSYSQRTQKLWAELINSAGDIDKELVMPESRFKQPEGIVQRSFCATSGLLPSELCQKAGLVKSDIFNAKFVPSKVDDSLIDGKKSSLVVVDGKEVPAGSNTPKEFTSGEGYGLAFNPDFLKKHGYDKLGDISLLFPRTNRELWERIGTSGAVSSNSIKDTGSSPSPPTSVSASGNKISWNKSGSKNVVGYRIFAAKEKGGNYKLVGHTTGTSISISSGSGVIIVKAVDYFGRESGASNEVAIENIKEDKKDKENEKQKESNEENKDEKKQEKKDEKKKQEKEQKKQDKEQKAKNENENGKEKNNNDESNKDNGDQNSE